MQLDCWESLPEPIPQPELAREWQDSRSLVRYRERVSLGLPLLGRRSRLPQSLQRQAWEDLLETLKQDQSSRQLLFRADLPQEHLS